MTLFVVVETMMLYPDDSFEEVSIERELEENLAEGGESKSNHFNLFGFGGGLINSKVSIEFNLDSLTDNDRCLTFYPEKQSLSLTILYCRLKIAIS